MNNRLNISFFGSSLVSAYWNGAATYYRGILRNLHKLGHKITFYEPDAFDRQKHRDIADPPYAKVVVYPAAEQQVYRVMESARECDVLIKASGVGVFDDLLERLILQSKKPNACAVFWDVDAPATLERVYLNPADPFRALIPQYDFILTYGGGDPVVNAYKRLGAAQCIPIYNALDPSTHHPVPFDFRFEGTLGFLGNRMPDREERVDEFFFHAARKCRNDVFILGGSGWESKQKPDNVKYAGHVYTRDHNAFNSTPHAVLNINRASMARFGYSPPTRIFEAAGAGAAIITDHWEGIEYFLEPGEEILVAHDGEEVAHLLKNLTPDRARAIGHAAMKRVLAQHTYAHRAVEFESRMAERGVLV